ncbi:MAG: hypothetical protein ACXWCY_25815 [Burkholderiales bacterium]
MERWVLYKGVFGCWGWERLDETGEPIAESVQVLDEFEDCLKNAELHVAELLATIACPLVVSA